MSSVSSFPSLPPQPNPPINISPTELTIPPHPITLTPTPTESVAIRQYVITMGMMRTMSPDSVSTEELKEWSEYSRQLEAAVHGQGLLIDLNTTITTAVNDSLKPFVTAVNQLTNSIDSSEANIDNRIPKNCNAMAFKEAQRIDPSGHSALYLRALLKVKVGNPTDNIQLSSAVSSLLPVGNPLAIGTPMSSPPFPATVLEANNLSDQAISALQYAYNETFLIVTGDIIEQKRFQFIRWNIQEW